jgi:holo-[acyl-carrier protein] synthase
MIVGIGFDLVDIARVKRLVASKGDRALARLFTEGERAYAMAKRRPYVHLAARIAAKEAAFKALSGTPGARGIGWREMEVVPRPGARPDLRLHGSARRRARDLGVERLWLTLSHSEATAGAVVVLEGRGARESEEEG